MRILRDCFCVTALSALLLGLGCGREQPTTWVVGPIDGCPNLERDTARVVPLLSGEIGDRKWKWSFYKNESYSCAYEGFQTFLLVEPSGTSADEPRPLYWVLRGGVSGAFNEDGTFLPEPRCVPIEECAAAGEGAKDLLSDLSRLNPGLLDKVVSDPSGFRVLVTSACDLDFHSGVDQGAQIDKLNPYITDENGEPRRADGLLASLAALDWVKQTRATDQVIIYGISSGGMGAATILSALSCEGTPPSGVITDGGMISAYLSDINLADCTLNHEIGNVEYYFDRIGAMWTEESLIHTAIAKGRIDTPLFIAYGSDDSRYRCPSPDGLITVFDKDGNAITGTGVQVVHQPVAEAVREYNPGGDSVVLDVCVNANPAETELLCDAHGVLRVDYGDRPDDVARLGFDPSEVAYEWVLRRLTEPPPTP